MDLRNHWTQGYALVVDQQLTESLKSDHWNAGEFACECMHEAVHEWMELASILTQVLSVH